MRRFFAWLVANRTSPRAAFTLRVCCMGAAVVLSLVWTRALLHGLGAENFGLLTSFSAFLAIASAGDLGMGGAVGMRTNQLIAAGDEDELVRFHSVARSTLLVASVAAAALCLALSPWLPGWLHFDPHVARGSLAALFATGSLCVGLSIFSSYLNNASYGAGTVSWGILPGFLVVQAAAMAQVTLCYLGAPLWAIQMAATFFLAVNFCVLLVIFRHSHPIFSRKLPFCFARRELLELGRTSVWSYLFGVFTLIYTATDRLIINAYFGAQTVSVFHLNNRLPELAFSVVGTAAFAAVPRVTNLMLRSDPKEAAHGGVLAAKLAQVQSFIAMAAVLFYLLVNDLFIRWVFGPTFLGPLGLQFAFGAALLLVSNGDIYTHLASRLSHGGLRLTALTLLATGFLNLALSILSARYLHWMEGVGWSTFIAHFLLFFVVTGHVQRRYRFRERSAIFVRSLFAPLAAYSLACACKLWLGRSGPWGFLALAGIYAGLLLVYSILAGPGPAELWHDLASAWHTVVRRKKIADSPLEPPSDASSHPAAVP